MKKVIVILFFTLIIANIIFSLNTLSDKKALSIKITEFLKNKNVNPYIIIFLISVLPFIELRGSIPIGILFLNLEWIPVIIVSIIGNMLPIFFIILFFDLFEKILRKISFFNKFFDWLFKRVLSKSKPIEKYKEIGLVFFIGIPLPMTGAWTGSLIAYLLKLSYLKSIIFIFLGVLSAAVIVTTITYFKIVGLIVALIIFIGITLISAAFKKD